MRSNIDEYVRNKWQRETNFVIEIIHRSREFLDIHVCRWMNLSRDDHLLGSRVNRTKRQDLFNCVILLDNCLQLLEQARRNRLPHEEIRERTGLSERRDRE